MFSLRCGMKETQLASAQFYCSNVKAATCFGYVAAFTVATIKAVNMRVVFVIVHSTSTTAMPHVKIKKFHCTASLSGNS